LKRLHSQRELNILLGTSVSGRLIWENKHAIYLGIEACCGGPPMKKQDGICFVAEPEKQKFSAISDITSNYTL